MIYVHPLGEHGEYRKGWLQWKVKSLQTEQEVHIHTSLPIFLFVLLFNSVLPKPCQYFKLGPLHIENSKIGLCCLPLRKKIKII
jgi:hypothetical protein